MKNRYIIPSVTEDSSRLPAAIRLYTYSTVQTEGNLLELKDGAVPFFIKFFFVPSTSTVNLDGKFLGLKSELIDRKRRISKEYIVDNFNVYNIADYGHQSLSPSFDDFIALCYDANGYKIPQHKTAYIKNYTTKETFIITEASIAKIIILRASEIKAPKEVVLTRNTTDEEFIFNLKEFDVNDVADLSVYIRVNNVYYELKESEYFLSFEREDIGLNLANTYVAKQQTYFKKLQNLVSGATDDRKYLDQDVIVNTLVNVNEIYIKPKQENRLNYYYLTYGQLNDIYFEKTEDVEVYKRFNDNSFIKLIPGIDYYIIDNNLDINGETSSSALYEVVVNNFNDRIISLPFTGKESFDIHSALYNNNIADWNINLNNSSVFLFEDGKLIEDITEYTSSSRYEYYIADIVLDDITTPTDEVVELLPSFYQFVLSSPFRIQTDPYYNSYNESSFVTSPTEAFIYDGSVNMKLSENEFSISGNKLYIGEDGMILPTQETVVDNFITDYTLFRSGNKKLSTLINGNASILNIEENIATVKQNIESMLDNSGISDDDFVEYTSSVDGKSFLSLVVKPDIDKPFNITYYAEDSEESIKTEYHCEIQTNGYYYSLPFFLDTFNGPKKTARFEIEYADGDEFTGDYFILK
jgi:hypothetical protein